MKPLHVATLAGLRGVRVGEAQVPGPQGSEDSFIFVINTQGAPGNLVVIDRKVRRRLDTGVRLGIVVVWLSLFTV